MPVVPLLAEAVLSADKQRATSVLSAVDGAFGDGGVSGGLHFHIQSVVYEEAVSGEIFGGG